MPHHSMKVSIVACSQAVFEIFNIIPFLVIWSDQAHACIIRGKHQESLQEHMHAVELECACVLSSGTMH